MKNKFIIFDTSCIVYFIFFCLYNITMVHSFNKSYRDIYDKIFIFIPVIIFIITIIQEKMNNKNIALFLIIKVALPILIFSYLYKFTFTILYIIDLFYADEVVYLLSISIPVLMVEFILEQLLYNFLRKMVIKN